MVDFNLLGMFRKANGSFSLANILSELVTEIRGKLISVQYMAGMTGKRRVRIRVCFGEQEFF